MKKTFFYLLFLCSGMTLNACGLKSMSSNTSEPASTNDIFTSLLGAAKSKDNVGDVLTTLLKSVTGQKESICGTWVYSSPKVVFESDKVLSKIGGAVASSKVESKLGEQLTKIGLKQGLSELTLNTDSTCTLKLATKTMSGTYSYDEENSVLTMNGTFGLAKVNSTCMVSNDELYILYDADKLLSIITAVSSKTSTLNSFSTILKGFSGLKLGWTMKKKAEAAAEE